MFKRRAVALFTAAGIAAVACGGGGTPTAAPTAAPTAGPTGGPTEAPSPAVGEKCNGEKVTFMLSFIPNVQHAGFLVASARGYYADEGLEVEIVPAGPGVDVAQDVADGTVDIGQVDYVNVVEAREAGVRMKVIGQTYKLPFFFWYTKKDSGIDTLEDWKGKKVGSIQLGDYPERDAMLISAGLNPRTDIVPTQQDFGTDDFIAGRVDIGEGVVFYHPAFLIGVNQMAFPDDFNVFWPADYDADFASQTIAANEEFLAANPAAATCFLRASVRGWQATFQDREAAVKDVMTFIPEGAIPEPHQQGAIHSVLPIVGSGADDATLLEPTPDNYAETVAKLQELGYLGPNIDVAATFDRSYYDAMGPVPAP